MSNHFPDSVLYEPAGRICRTMKRVLKIGAHFYYIHELPRLKPESRHQSGFPFFSRRFNGLFMRPYPSGTTCKSGCLITTTCAKSGFVPISNSWSAFLPIFALPFKSELIIVLSFAVYKPRKPDLLDIPLYRKGRRFPPNDGEDVFPYTGKTDGRILTARCSCLMTRRMHLIEQVKRKGAGE